jgi:hypothetical protein
MANAKKLVKILKNYQVAYKIASWKPIDAWPVRQYKGKPGYSAKHFQQLAGTQEDPLRIAERIEAKRIADIINNEFTQKINNGENINTVLKWVEETDKKLRQESWDRLCNSFDAVIEVLKTDPKLKYWVDEAKRIKNIR